MRPLPVQPRIDDPVALLRACHDKVRQFTQLAQRLHAHVRAHGADTQAREAAQAVLRYFNQAAPLHHDDEDEDLFVALGALGDAALDARMTALSAEHDALLALWQGLSPWLLGLTQGQLPPAPWPDVDAFAERYRTHAHREETEVYPHAERLTPATLMRLAAAMSARRTPGAPSTHPD